MVKDIFDAFIKQADRINFMVLLPDVFSFMDANDVTFETATSSKIKTIKLYYKYNVATQSIGLVIAHGGYRIDTYGNSLDTYGNEVLCHKMLKYGLKLDRVHTYKGFSMSQIDEKVTWVIEKTRGSHPRGAKF